MGGDEKSLLPLGNKTLLAQVRDRLGHQVDHLALNANGDTSRFAGFGLDVFADTMDGFQGPLAGVLAGMRWAQEKNLSDKIITVATDTPFFPLAYVDQMLAAANGNQIVLAASDGRRHPVFGLWDISLANDLEQFLLSGDRKVMLFVQKYANTAVKFAIEPVDPFFNVNTPQDLELAQSLLKEQVK